MSGQQQPTKLTEGDVEKFFAAPNKYKSMPPYPVISSKPTVTQTLLAFSPMNLLKIVGTGTAAGLLAGKYAAQIPGSFWTFGRGFWVGFGCFGLWYAGLHQFDESKARLMGWRPNGFAPVIPGYTHSPGTIRMLFSKENLPPTERTLDPTEFFSPVLRRVS